MQRCRPTRTVSLKQLAPNESCAPGITVPALDTLRSPCLKLFVSEAISPRHGGLDPTEHLGLGHPRKCNAKAATLRVKKCPRQPLYSRYSHVVRIPMRLHNLPCLIPYLLYPLSLVVTATPTLRRGTWCVRCLEQYGCYGLPIQRRKSTNTQLELLFMCAVCVFQKSNTPGYSMH